MTEPDWQRIRDLSTEMHALIAAGQLDRTAFARIVGEARTASHGFNEVLEAFYNFDPDPSD